MAESLKGINRKVGRAFRVTTPLPAGAGRHAYARILGLTSHTPALIRQIQKGFPFKALERLQSTFALSTDEVILLVQIPQRTLTRRREAGRLRADESDRLLRGARLMHRATTLFNGDRALAKEWMTSRQPTLGEAVPLELASTELGAREVEDALGRIEDGVFA